MLEMNCESSSGRRHQPSVKAIERTALRDSRNGVELWAVKLVQMVMKYLAEVVAGGKAQEGSG
jgi:hypothetical protein